MKNMIMTITLFIFLTFLWSNKALALVSRVQDNIKLIPTATPTPIIYKKIEPNVNLQLVVTVTPTQTPVVITQVVTQAIKKVTPTETELSPIITQVPSTESSLVATKTAEKPESKENLSRWFINITLGLLVLIIIIQSWPKKKES